MAQVTVTIAGRAYRMACEDGEENRLSGLAQSLDEKISEMRTHFGEIGDQRLVVMSAIAIADELAETKQRLARAVSDLEQARAEIIEDRDRGGAWTEQLADGLDRASERLERLTRSLNLAGRE